MPSAYLMYATTPDGSGTPDLIHNSADALASTAAFLKGHGWQSGAGWNEGEPNFAAILQWNSAEIYAKTVALFADRLAPGSSPGACPPPIARPEGRASFGGPMVGED